MLYRCIFKCFDVFTRDCGTTGTEYINISTQSQRGTKAILCIKHDTNITTVSTGDSILNTMATLCATCFNITDQN